MRPILYHDGDFWFRCTIELHSIPYHDGDFWFRCTKLDFLLCIFYGCDFPFGLILNRLNFLNLLNLQHDTAAPFHLVRRCIFHACSSRQMANDLRRVARSRRRSQLEGNLGVAASERSSRVGIELMLSRSNFF